MIKWPWNRKSVELTPEDAAIREAYLLLFKKKPFNKIPIESLKYVVLDTETSGLDIKKDTILSIAAIKIIDAEICVDERLECYIQDDGYFPDRSIEIHGITRNQINEGQDIKSVIRKFVEYLGDALIVGHHIAFDFKMLDKYVYSQLGFHLRNHTLDTSHLHHRLEYGVNERAQAISLDVLAEKYCVPLGERHTAAADAFITATIFLKMLNGLKKRGVNTCKELLR